MQQEVVLEGSRQALDQSGVPQGAERGGDDRLGFAAGEQGGPMRPGQQAHVNREGPDGGSVAAVYARLAVQHPAANQFLLQPGERIRHRLQVAVRLLFAAKRFDDLLAQLADGRQPLHLVGDEVGVAQAVFRRLGNLCRQRFVGRFRRPVPSRLAGFLGQLGDRIDHHLHFLVGEQHRAEHFVLGELLSFGLHHKNGFAGAGNHHVQPGGFKVRIARIEPIAIVRVAHAGRAQRTLEGNAGKRQRRGGSDHRRDVRVPVLLRRQDRGHHLNLIHEPLGKQGTNGAVDEPGGQGLLLRRTPLPSKKAAGNFAGGIGFLLIVHRERKERLAGTLVLHANCGDQNHRVVNGHQGRPGRLPGDAARFDAHGLAAK